METVASFLNADDRSTTEKRSLRNYPTPKANHNSVGNTWSTSGGIWIYFWDMLDHIIIICRVVMHHSSRFFSSRVKLLLICPYRCPSQKMTEGLISPCCFSIVGLRGVFEMQIPFQKGRRHYIFLSQACFFSQQAG